MPTHGRLLERLIQRRHAIQPMAVAVIPVKRAVPADRALPGKHAEHRQQAHLCPSPAVQAAEVARPALLTDSLTQWIDLLIGCTVARGPFSVLC